MRGGHNLKRNHHRPTNTSPSRNGGLVTTVPQSATPLVLLFYTPIHSTMEEFEALLSRERHYRREDYLSGESSHKIGTRHKPTEEKVIEGLPTAALLNMLEECASLVTDNSSKHRLESLDASLATKGSSTIPRSPSAVSAIPTESELQKSSTENTGKPFQDFLFWRKQMCSWAFTVVKSFRIETEAVSIAFNLLDRYVVHELKTPGALDITREDYQLFAMAALYIAVKAHVPYPRKISVDALVVMSRNFYSAEDLYHTERDMLSALGWKICPPTVMTFCRHFLEYSAWPKEDLIEETTDKKKKVVEDICLDLSERIVQDPFFVPLQDAWIAFACVSFAFRSIGASEEDLRAQFLPHLGVENEANSSARLAAIFDKLGSLCK